MVLELGNYFFMFVFFYTLLQINSKIMSKKLQLLCVAILGSVLLKGQSLDLVDDHKDKSTKSATGAPSQQWDDWFNKEVEKFDQELLAGKTASLNYQIPVVFHVIHFGQAIGTFQI